MACKFKVKNNEGEQVDSILYTDLFAYYENTQEPGDSLTAEQRADRAYDTVLGPQYRGEMGDWLLTPNKYKPKNEEGGAKLDSLGQPEMTDVLHYMEELELSKKPWNTGKFDNVISRELNRIQNAIYILERKINSLGREKRTIALRTKLKQTKFRLLEKLAEQKGAEGILIYTKEALDYTNEAFGFLEKWIEDHNAGIKKINAEDLQKVYEYIMAFDDINSLISDITSGEIVVAPEVIDILREIYEKQQQAKALYTKYGVDLVSERFAQNSDATRIVYSEEKRKEFLKNNKKEKGETEEAYQKRLSEYVNSALDNTEHLWQGDRAREHITRLLLAVSADISWVQRWLVDGNNTDSLLISIVNKELSLTEDRARLEYEKFVEELHGLWVEYRAHQASEGKDAGNSTEFYALILERSLEDGNVATQHIVGKFHSGWVKALAERDRKFRELKETKGEAEALKFRKAWNKKNLELSSKITALEKKNYYALQAKAQRTGDWSGYNKFRDKLDTRLSKTQDILFIPKGAMAEKYKSTQYQAIQDLGKDHIIYKYYAKLQETILMSNEMLPPDYKRKNNKLLSRRKGLWERLQDVEQKWNPSQWWTSFVMPWWEEKYKLTQEDTDFDVTTERMKSDGKKGVKVNQREKTGEYIPIHYTAEIEIENQSFDVMSDVLQGLWGAINYKHMSQLLPYLEITRHMMAERQTKVASGALEHVSQIVGIGDVKQTAAGKESNEYSMLLDLIADRVYGKRMTDYGDLPFGSISINKMIGFLGYYTGLQLLGLSWISGIVNVNLALTTANIEAIGNEFFGVKDLYYAKKEYSLDTPFIMMDIGKIEPSSKTNLLGRKFDPMNDFRAVENKYAYNTKVKQLAQSGAFFLFNHIGEHFVQNLAMYAVLNRAKLKNHNGEYINAAGEVVKSRNAAAGFDKAYETIDNKLVLKDFIGSVETDTGGVLKNHRLVEDTSIDNRTARSLEETFVIKQVHLMQEVNKRLHGAYSNRNKNMFQRTGAGSLMIAMRKYLSPSIVYRYQGITGALKWTWDYAMGKNPDNSYYDEYGSKRVNLMTGTVGEGAYSSGTKFFSKALIDFIHQLKQFKFSLATMTRENWRTLSKSERSNIMRSIFDIGIGTIMATIATSAKSGDEDERNYFLAYFAFRLHSELIMYVNPNEFMRIMASPAVSMTMLERTINFLTQLGNDAFGGEPDWDRYQAGKRKGQTRISKRVRDLVPFYYQFERHKYMPDVVDYYYRGK